MDRPLRLERTSEPLPAAAPLASPARMAAINTLLTLVQTIVIAVFGYMLTGRLDQAIKERQMSVQERQATVQNLEKMVDLLTKVNDENTDHLARAQATAQLSMYGSDAVFPMFVMAASRSPRPPTEAINGLRLLAVQRRDEVCTVLLSAQQIPKSLNEIRRKAIEELTAELKCAKAERGP